MLLLKIKINNPRVPATLKTKVVNVTTFYGPSFLPNVEELNSEMFPFLNEFRASRKHLNKHKTQETNVTHVCKRDDQHDVNWQSVLREDSANNLSCRWFSFDFK